MSDSQPNPPVGFHHQEEVARAWEFFLATIRQITGAPEYNPQTGEGLHAACVMVNAPGKPTMIANAHPDIATDLLAFHVEHHERTVQTFVESEKPN